ncbi:hypothetical protein BDR07DRAFT_1418730 [Suillus spraguei]|nr:hypothetical protein BDR07DRAFT_1437872 [Suillus spraguei]KAG2357999.1 hypothetical protein BDR07DRAFT_1418730 [Suillus spraguei]
MDQSLGDSNNPFALDNVAFFPHRSPAPLVAHMRKLILILTEIKSGKSFRGILQIFGGYDVEGLSGIQAMFQDIRKVVGGAL